MTPDELEPITEQLKRLSEAVGILADALLSLDGQYASLELRVSALEEQNPESPKLELAALPM